MIPFRCRRDGTGTPMIRNRDIWTYAERLARDYRPELLKEASPFPAEHFLESYLGATLDYQDLYYEKGESPIAGATVFRDEIIRVFDREGACTRCIPVKAGTILIDNATVSAEKPGFERFTVLHEAGHYTMHAEAYLRAPEKSWIAERESGAGLVCCRRNALVRTYGKRRHLTPAENREHQANTFAAFIAMPRQTFVPLARELIRKEGFSDGILSYTPDDWECDYALENVCNALSEAYGVSYTAAQVHLRELDLVLNYHIYEERKEKMYYPG